MSEPSERVMAMRDEFRDHYRRETRFREDGALADELAQEAEPVLEVLETALAPTDGPRAWHEGYALLTLLARRAATLGATPSAALALHGAVVQALRGGGVALDREQEGELAIVVVEGYGAGRDERLGRELRALAAAQQVAFELAPRCLAIYLAGRHDEADLAPTLERWARDLLRLDAQSCLLDVSRLDCSDEDVARALGQFCAQAATLGVQIFIFGATLALRAQFQRWSLSQVSASFIDDYRAAQAQALAAAGSTVRVGRRWVRLLFPAWRALVR